jgi:outer membrane protein TolC
MAQTELSAKDAVLRALEGNYQIHIASKQHEINEKNNTWSQAGLYPTIELSAGNNNTIIDNTNNPFTFTPGIILNQSINPAANLNWNIFTGFSIRMSKRRFEQLEEQSANNSMTVIETAIQDVLKGYYTAQLQNERKNLFSSILNLSRERYEYYQIKEKYSGSTSLELLQFKNQYLTDSINYLMQEISYTNSVRNLKLLMNDSTDIEYVLTDDLELAIEEIDFSNAEELMFSQNSNLKNQYISLELQQTNTALQRAFLYPTLSFQAGVNPGWSWIKEIKDNAFETDTRSLSYYGNFNLRYTLFNNWQNRRAIETSKIQEEIAQLSIDEMKFTLSNTLKNLVELYEARTQLVNISTQNIDYAKQAYELGSKRFDLGTINSIDLTNLQNTYENTMITHYENLFNKLDTYLEIVKLTGVISLNYEN